ncbi:hypothetical protein [Sphingobacterium siyangense]|uniref:hypothetical protein n=1 Tax=Sphingobacterium siyangense TaxID=459529 RepID=UPI003C735465
MKKYFIMLLLFSCIGVAWGQVKIDYGNYTIDISATPPINYESEIDYNSAKDSNKKVNFTYKIKIPEKYNLAITRNSVAQPMLSVPDKDLDSSSDCIFQGIMSFDINTEYLITITDENGDNKKVYKFRTKSSWSWTTTFGANAIFFTNRNKFISKVNSENNQIVEEVQDKKQMEFMPAIMFTFMNNHKDVSHGFTGGIGVNLEEIAVFTGLSLGFGQNIILTAGVAGHKQTRPKSDYYIGQVIDSSITSDNLNESQYRFNPFFGISFRIAKNPFGKKSE